MPNKTVGITFFSAPCYNYLACDINVDIMMNIFDQEEPTIQGTYVCLVEVYLLYQSHYEVLSPLI